MMVFSRNDKKESIALDLKPLIEDNIKMLRSIIPSTININLELAEIISLKLYQY